MHVQRRQDVVQDQYLGPRIDGPGKRHPRLLPSAQSQPPLSDLRLVSSLEQCQISAQSALVDDLAVPILVELRTEQDVVADGLVLYPRFLSGIGHTILPGKVEPRVWPRRDVVQLSQQRHQKGGLPAAGRSDDQVDFALFEDHLILDPQAELSPGRTRSDDSRGLGGPGERRIADADK